MEPVFGQIKQARGFRQFLLRGIEISLTNLRASFSIAHHIADAPPACSDPPVGDIDEPGTKQISPGFEKIGTEPAERKIASFEEGGEGAYHGRSPFLVE